MRYVAAAFLFCCLSPALSGASALNDAELKRLQTYLDQRAGTKNARPLTDNVKIRIHRYELLDEHDRIHRLLLDFQKKKTEGTRKLEATLSARSGLPARSGLQITGISSNTEATLERSLKKQLGATATVTSLLTQVRRKSYVSVLKRSREAYDVTYSIPTQNPFGPGSDEPILIENVVGTGLQLEVLSANRLAVVIRLIPYFNARETDSDERGKRRILVEELATTIRARPGEAILIGGTDGGSKSAFKSIFSNRDVGGKQSSMIVLYAYPHDTVKDAKAP